MRSACYFCGERALDVWSGQTKADVVADWVAGAKAKGLKVKADAALDAELDAFIDADLWFRTALKQAGLG